MDYIVDRENARIGLAVDFGEINWFSIPEALRDEPFSGNVHGLLFGADVSTANLNSPMNYDDIIIFNRAFTQADVDRLAEYYQAR